MQSELLGIHIISRTCTEQLAVARVVEVFLFIMLCVTMWLLSKRNKELRYIKEDMKGEEE